jgi:lipopolysaccharide assembly outer membrane protein LptD (OstA)
MKYLLIAGLIATTIHVNKPHTLPVANKHLVTSSLDDKTPLDSLKTKLVVRGSDSINVDEVNNLIHYYGNVEASYGRTKINAQYIKVDIKNQLLYANKVSVMSINGPSKESLIQADSIKFNLKTQRLISYMASAPKLNKSN